MVHIAGLAATLRMFAKHKLLLLPQFLAMRKIHPQLAKQIRTAAMVKAKEIERLINEPMALPAKRYLPNL